MTALIVPTVNERVAAGAAWLDERHPGWVTRIELDWLDLSKCGMCILGQLFGDYFATPEFTGLDRCDRQQLAAGLGFDIDEWRDKRGTYTVLTEAWRRLVAARQAGSEDAGAEKSCCPPDGHCEWHADLNQLVKWGHWSTGDGSPRGPK